MGTRAEKHAFLLALRRADSPNRHSFAHLRIGFAKGLENCGEKT
jgi:hypothetical protein